MARFWAQLLEGYRVAPYDEGDLRRLVRMGIREPEDEVVRNRNHLDRSAEVTRLVALGAPAVKE